MIINKTKIIFQPKTVAHLILLQITSQLLTLWDQNIKVMCCFFVSPSSKLSILTKTLPTFRFKLPPRLCITSMTLKSNLHHFSNRFSMSLIISPSLHFYTSAIAHFYNSILYVTHSLLQRLQWFSMSVAYWESGHTF